MDKKDALRYRIAPLEMTPSEFRKTGRQLVERIAEFLCTLPNRPVTPNKSPQAVWGVLGRGSLPEQGKEAKDLLKEAATLLFEHSTLNGHPRFWGMITSSAAPIGALGDLLAAAVNPHMGGWIGGPMTNEIEAQHSALDSRTDWLSSALWWPVVSGGNMGNFVGFLAARKAKASWDVHAVGLLGEGARCLRVYTSSETHSWIQKATDTFGLGTDAIRWIPVDTQLRMDPTALRNQVQQDFEAGDLPFLVIGTAGAVNSGAVDPLPALAAVCREYDLWFHVDGSYGGFAALLLHEHQGVEVPSDLEGISLADSVAVDPHTWLYAPLEAGCILMRDQLALRETFSSHLPSSPETPEVMAAIYDDEYGAQTSRGFHALSVWLAFRQVGRAGYVEIIADDIRLAQELYRLVEAHPELQVFTQGLSITTFRYVPPDLIPGSEQVDAYLNSLNSDLLYRLQRSGEAFLSHAVVRGTFLLRACVMNFRTSLEDIEALPAIVTRIGKEVDTAVRSGNLNT